MGSFALMLLFVNRTLYTFCCKLIKYSLLHLGYYKIGMVILQSLFSITVDKVHLQFFYHTKHGGGFMEGHLNNSSHGLVLVRKLKRFP